MSTKMKEVINNIKTKESTIWKMEEILNKGTEHVNSGKLPYFNTKIDKIINACGDYFYQHKNNPDEQFRTEDFESFRKSFYEFVDALILKSRKLKSEEISFDDNDQLNERDLDIYNMVKNAENPKAKNTDREI